MESSTNPQLNQGGWSAGVIKTEVLAGLTVALALVPEAVAFSFVAKVEPLVGLYAAFLVGLVTAIFGGRPGMISGATGALAIVMVDLVKDYGVEYLFATVILMGIFQLLAALFHLGRFIRIVPHPVMLGFVNGLAIVIFLSQLDQFKVDDEWMASDQLMIMGGLVAATMAIIYLLPKLTKAVPSALVAIVAVSAVVIGFGLDTRTVGDVASIKGGLPEFNLSYFWPTVETSMVPASVVEAGTQSYLFGLISAEQFWEIAHVLKVIVPYALILAAIGLIESLLTLTVVADMTETHGSVRKECMAQGLANVVTGFFGGMGGCAMIGQSMINVSSGARRRLGGIVAAVMLLSFILFASQLIEQIPVAALVGVMFVVVIGTFEWASFKIMKNVPKEDAFVLALVTIVTVFTDLAMAVVIGVIVSALVYAWKAARHIHVSTENGEKGEKIYKIDGPLFFGSSATFRELFNPQEDPQDVVVDFADCRVLDHSGIEAIDALAGRYMRHGKQLHLKHLSADCRHLLTKASRFVEANDEEDPHYGVAVDYARSPEAPSH